MNKHSTDNNDISVQNLSHEQYPHANKHHVKNSRQNQINSGELGIVVNKKKMPMTPTPLYIFFFFFLNYHPSMHIFLLENIHVGQQIQLQHV
jgi:hypothetical protein